MPQDEGKTVTTTADSSPWAPQQPFLKFGFQRGQELLDRGAHGYYPSKTVADTSSQTTAGQNAAFGQAGQAADLNKYTTGGGFLSAGNPHFQQMAGQIGQAIRPSIDSAFAANGRLGSGAHAQAYSSAMADKVGTLAYQNYSDERQRQIGAAGDYSAPNAMMGIGQQLERKQGEYNADGKSRWDYAQGGDQEALDRFMSTVGGRGFGEQKSSSQPMQGNSTQSMIGTLAGALGGLGNFASSTKGLLWGK